MRSQLSACTLLVALASCLSVAESDEVVFTRCVSGDYVYDSSEGDWTLRLSEDGTYLARSCDDRDAIETGTWTQVGERHHYSFRLHFAGQGILARESGHEGFHEGFMNKSGLGPPYLTNDFSLHNFAPSIYPIELNESHYHMGSPCQESIDG